MILDKSRQTPLNIFTLGKKYHNRTTFIYFLSKLILRNDMKLEVLILGITGFLIFNTYHDGKYTKLFYNNKKYIQIGFFALVGVSLYLMAKRNPSQCKTMLMHANNVIKYMPIDKSSMDMISPILDFTEGNNNQTHFMQDFNLQNTSINNQYERKILQSGGSDNTIGKKPTKRSVSETKKKYVASQQAWKCNECKKELNAWFEVDHCVRLEHGGGNNVENLVALCRECHGCKTAMENM